MLGVAGGANRRRRDVLLHNRLTQIALCVVSSRVDHALNCVQAAPTADAAMFFFMTDSLNFSPEFLGRLQLFQGLAELLGDPLPLSVSFLRFQCFVVPPCIGRLQVFQGLAEKLGASLRLSMSLFRFPSFAVSVGCNSSRAGQAAGSHLPSLVILLSICLAHVSP